MYAVNASIPKTLVRYLINWVADHEMENTTKEILMDVLDTPVSPELLPPSESGEIQQKTEEVVGPYELHDFYLYQMMRYGFSPRKVLKLAEMAFGSMYTQEHLLQWLKKFYYRFFSQQFKRSCLPDGPKVGSICLSPRGDWRMPSDAVVKIWINELESLS
jgi:NAD+ synthase (glutamine-hydrolysing)